MDDEKIKTVEAEKPVSIVDEARAIRDEIRQEREKLEAANEETKKLKTEELLNGTTGGPIETEAKEETPQEYKDRVLRGDMNENP